MTATTIEKAHRLDDYDLPVFMAKAAGTGEVTKAELGELLNRRVVKNKRPEESFQQAYAAACRGPGLRRRADIQDLPRHDRPGRAPGGGCGRPGGTDGQDRRRRRHAAGPALHDG
jgi:hypothetical protein